MSRRYVSVRVNTDVEIDLGEIDTGDLQDELDTRKTENTRRMTDGITTGEAHILRGRVVEELNRQATRGSLHITFSMREYFWKVYGIDL